jgi:hypothetical protein
MSLVHVFLPTGSKTEAAIASAALRPKGLKLIMASARGHTPGQTISGDAIIVGKAPRSIEQDIQGRIWVVDDLASLAHLDVGSEQIASKATAPPPVSRREVASPAGEEQTFEQALAASMVRRDVEAAPEVGAVAAQDSLDVMKRVELIQHAGKTYPGQGHWAAMTNDQIRAKLRELSDG